MKRNRLSYVLIIFIFIVGISVILYPFISNWWNQREQDVIVKDYTQAYEEMSQQEIQAELEKSKEYNEGLLRGVVLTDPFNAEANKEATEEYEALLNINGDGVMGVIEIPQINVSLAIYHGTSSDVLKKGVGHLSGTSLPVGGTASHAVLSAHTGYPTAELFTNLVDLEEGDLFYLTVMSEKLAYQIDQIKVVTPDETSDLRIDPDEDYVTLVTCTPYGVNSHRLLVRGTRVPYVEEDKQPVVKTNRYLIFAIILLIVLSVITIRLIVRKIKRGRQHET